MLLSAVFDLEMPITTMDLCTVSTLTYILPRRTFGADGEDEVAVYAANP